MCGSSKCEEENSQLASTKKVSHRVPIPPQRMGKKTRQSKEKVEVLIRLRSEINEIENRAAREKSLKQTNKPSYSLGKLS